ncbi:LOW QUALITY PROTEIN: hypothetical protein TorRG33x02_242980 [Trema orientale]|uniref:Uncharacterized protein n=1 Tax=Trema orientale TaxID=63057 RepID=A0A2P5DSV2_TREOI|nr:LOW QUALITY PROTEIN: hypothetical protein TorRG33x02_242980 [Trema orientale]
MALIKRVSLERRIHIILNLSFIIYCDDYLSSKSLIPPMKSKPTLLLL